ncbi:MAG: extracellular solute-binding protein [Oscillospiraceae bacterium]|nr:extracellular solute-binding protein [Oscillospiraceae bacterium]MBQ6697861.1 extracellular solute-binding protein [Oscillospiraceae bacterium]
MKKLISLILATVMLFALCSCGGANGATKLSGEGANEPLTKDDVIQFMVESSASWPVREEWKIWEYMEEGSGATLNIISVPASDAGTKYPLMFAAREELPDLLAFGSANAHTSYAGEGLVAFEDVEAYMPNYNAWLESLTEDEYNTAVKPRKRADGKIYYTPGTGREGKTRMRAWLYREDIFKKHNLKVPETFDELYAVCKELKKLYPDSYPFCTRSMSYLFDIPGSSFDKWWQYGAYYDFDDEEWRWGATEDTALEVVTFYKKMIDEKLMPSDSVTLNNATWEEFMLTDKGFILPHLQLRIDYFNQLAHQGGNAEYKLQAFAPPVANAEKGASMIERGDLEMIGFSIPDSGREDGIANAAKFLDWMYTDEAMELVSWGKEGETYEVVDGKKKYITDENGTQPNTMYGFQLYGTFCRLDPLAAEALQSETTIESEKLIVEHTLPEYPVTLWLDFNDEEQSVIDMYRTGLHTYTEEMLIKFMLGQEPLANFDKFVENLKSMGVDEVIAAYESAYSRVK